MISIAPCANYSPELCERALRDALAPIGGLDWVRPGMTVGIKANLVSLMKPASAAITHPALLCALAKLIAEKGATAVVGDSPGGLFAKAYVSRVYAATGVRAIEMFGGRLNEDFSQKTAEFPAALKIKRFAYTAWLDSCDGIINFSKLKTHGMMGMSATDKNMFGAIPGTRKPELHYLYPDARDFADMLVDLNEYAKPRLNIVDAVVGMEGNGPTMGTPRTIGCVIAGANPYEVDTACARIIGITPEAAPTLAAARDRGLAPAEVEVFGDIAPFILPDFALAPRHDVLFFKGKLLGPMVTAFMQSKPALLKRDCVGCGRCGEVCPASAIVLRRKIPVIDRKKCIRCFCCQELCPKGAMVARRPAVARLLSK
jgi:uncharacterized protein (DUF362 family)/Pyruvate/2-oxoacid:ferredoxin oxidoreductase delta subunit